MNKEPWIQTYSGKKFYPLNPRSEDIDIYDIGHHLAMICRFTGAVKKFYSVAEHCVYVSYICDKSDALFGLLHDSSEYALTDFSSPLKRSGEFENYKKYEKQLQSMIYQKYCGSEEEPASVKQADLQLLSTEATQLLKSLHPEWIPPTKPLPFKLKGLSPAKAKKLFLERFEELYNGK